MVTVVALEQCGMTALWGDVEDIHNDMTQLICAFFGHLFIYFNLSHGIASVNSGEHLPHVIAMRPSRVPGHSMEGLISSLVQCLVFKLCIK